MALARALGRLVGARCAPEMLLTPWASVRDLHRLAPCIRTLTSTAAAAHQAAPPPSGSSRSVGSPGSGSSSPGPQQQQPYKQQAAAGPSTVSREEAAKFAPLAGQWWDPSGPFAPLHAMNPVRCRFLRSALCSGFGRDASSANPLAGLRLLDVGCGGGLLAESLARMGAHVTGIDVNEGGIATAEAHAAQDPDLAGRLTYRTAAAEQLVQEGALFDAVIASEVIEHVGSVPAFCTALDALTRPGGGVAISTINRTPRSYALAILAAEYILRWVPQGTHEWERFLTPHELVLQMEESTGQGHSGGSMPAANSSGAGSSSSSSSSSGTATTGLGLVAGTAPGSSCGGGGAGVPPGGPLRLELLAGMEYNPLTRGWSLGRDTAVNYIAYFSKPA